MVFWLVFWLLFWCLLSVWTVLMSVLFDYCLSVSIYSLHSFALLLSFALVSAYHKAPFVNLKLERTFCLNNFDGGFQPPQLSPVKTEFAGRRRFSFSFIHVWDLRVFTNFWPIYWILFGAPLDVLDTLSYDWNTALQSFNSVAWMIRIINEPSIVIHIPVFSLEAILQSQTSAEARIGKLETRT